MKNEAVKMILSSTLAQMNQLISAVAYVTIEKLGV